MSTPRTESGMGWSFLINGGIFTDVFNIIGIKDGDVPPGAFTLGVELDLKSVYRFAPYAAFTFGFSMGFALATGTGLFTEQVLLYGVTAGFLF